MKQTPAMISEKEILRRYRQRPQEYWIDEGRTQRLALFRRMIKGVAAYRKFLRGNGFRLEKISSVGQLSEVPAVNKKNYFHLYPLSEILWDKTLETNGMVVTATSGSTGQPTYFLRNEKVDWHYSLLAEYFLRNGPGGSTLLIDCFGMGVWIGGLITYQAFRYAALRGHPLTIITPGINKKEIFHSLVKLAPQFKNVILAGYPPFIKDILDESEEQGIDFRKFNTRLLFAAESFTERFRDYLVKKARVKNIYTDTLNLYGTAELGAMAFETPTSIFIRRLALRHPRVWQRLFVADKLPTLAQYNPSFINFDQHDGRILITADSAMPFFRYDIGDNGGVMTLTQIEDAFAAGGINLRREAKKAGVILESLPFVYVYERSDFSTKLYGAIIYPEPIREALQDVQLQRWVTGKFAMLTKFDSRQNEFIEVNIELKKTAHPSKKIENLCQERIVQNLLKKNAEYKNNYGSIPKKVTPKIILFDYEEPTRFRPGTKQAWVLKS